MNADRDTLLSLAERVEAGEGPDPRLCAEIDCAIRFPALRPAEPDDFEGKYGYSPGNIKVEHGFLMSANYLLSLDAAVTLVPEGFLWFATNGGAAETTTPAMGRATAFCGHPDTVIDFDPVEASTPARALTAACLRAIGETANG